MLGRFLLADMVVEHSSHRLTSNMALKLRLHVALGSDLM
jgi:hypothetical protein